MITMQFWNIYKTATCNGIIIRFDLKSFYNLIDNVIDL